MNTFHNRFQSVSKRELKTLYFSLQDLLLPGWVILKNFSRNQLLCTIEESKKKIKALQQEMLKLEDLIRDKEAQIEMMREELSKKAA